MTARKKRDVLQEICVFAVLLVLIVAQVLVYNFDHGTKRYGLSMDKAKIVFFNNLSKEEINISYVSSNCFKCSETEVSVPVEENLTYIAQTDFPLKITLRTSSNSCVVTHHFKEYGLYYFNHSQGELLSCSFSSLDKGDYTYLSILYAVVIFVLLSVIWIAITQAFKYYTKGKHKSVQENENIQIDSSQDPYESKAESVILSYGSTESREKKKTSKVSKRSTPTLKSSLITEGTSDSGFTAPPKVTRELSNNNKRLSSLDTFRGLSLVIMIFVNYGGGGYWFFNHSKWNGLTIADLVFPWFIWIMGVSLVFSFQGRKKDSLFQQLYQILRRTVLLFALGLFFVSNDASTPLDKMRICGVLQRFAITYLVVAITELFTGYLYKFRNFTVWSPLKDITNNWVQWLMVLVFETLWLMFTFLLPVSDCPRGYLGPGGISDSGKHYNCTGGAARTIDYWILGEKHLYAGNTAKTLYQLDKRYDPEGILGSLNSIVLCYFGVQAGKTLLYFRERHRDILVRFIVWGVTLSALATLLCLGNKDEGIIPINKNLWSLSYILLMAGFGYLVLAGFYLIIDIFPVWNGAPFKYTGMNSIMIYLGHEILHDYFPFSVYDDNHTHLTLLSSNLIAVCVWMLVSYYWFSVGFFVKI